MDPFSSPITSAIWMAIIGCFVAAIFSLGFALQRRRAHVANGWRYLTPGPLMWFAVVGGALICALLVYMYFFVGSARSDAADEMSLTRYLAMAFSLSTALVAYFMAAEEVRWNDKGIERRTILWHRRSITWHQLARGGIEPSTGYWWVSSFDGPRIRFSPYYNGFVDLLRTIRERMPRDQPPTANVTSLETVIARAAVPARTRASG